MNIWQVSYALAPDYGSVIVGQSLGGLSLAGGSVTLGMVADIFEPDVQGFPLAYTVLSSVGGSAIGPIIGGIIQENLHWRWNFWIQLIVSVAAQIIHFFCVPDTRTTIIFNKFTRKRRKSGKQQSTALLRFMARSLSGKRSSVFGPVLSRCFSTNLLYSSFHSSANSVMLSSLPF